MNFSLTRSGRYAERIHRNVLRAFWRARQSCRCPRSVARLSRLEARERLKSPAPRTLLTEPQKNSLEADNLSAYVGNATGYVLVFTNGLRVYLAGDNALSGDMKTIIGGFYKANLAVINVAPSSMQPEEGAFAVNELIQPKSVIVSHTNEPATKGGRVNPGTRTEQFINLVKGIPVHVPLSGKTMELNGDAKCVAGC